MNNLETAIPFMKQLNELLEIKIAEVNLNLSKLGIRKVDLETSLTRIKEQIASAETKYTIAFVGTFKTGKSTIINSLLDLQGSARLSSEFDPDTAKCIRLMHKSKEQNYDAEIVFTDTYTTERMSWNEAKKYTSQVALDNSDSEIRKKADKIDEVRYYIDNPFLDVCNILDLPGTGTGAHSEHTGVTDRKMMEADCIFWVVSTDAEPDSESILNLEKFSTKMLPIINVWQCESDDIYSPIQPEEIKDMLLSQFGAYFASAEDPIFYYAGEIDLAQQENRELKVEWGKIAFTDKVEDILSNIQTGDRMQRIKKQINIALQTCDGALKDVLEDKALISLGQTEKNEGLEITKIRTKLSRAKELALGDIKDHAKKTAQEIIEIISYASDAFIENQMQGTNWKALFRKRKHQEELQRDFEKNYVKIKSGWLDNIVKEYSDDVLAIIKGIYSDFSIEMSTLQNNSTFQMDEDELSGFIEDMVKLMADDMGRRVTPTIIAAIAGGIMLLIPGGAILEALGTVVVGGIAATTGITKDDKLRSKITGIKNTSKVQIKQQRSTVVNNLNEAGKNVNDEMYTKIVRELDKRSDMNTQKKAQLKDLEAKIKNMISFINEQTEELSRI